MATSSAQISDCSVHSLTLPPSSDPASELRWPAHINLDTSPTFFTGLFEDASVHPKHEKHCHTATLSTPGILTNIPAQDGN